MRTIDLSQVALTEENATATVSAAQKFVIPVGVAEHGDAMIYPDGWVVDGKDVGGTPITDWQGKPLDGARLLFVNSVDRCLQTPLCDGNGVVIINQVDESRAAALFAWLDRAGGDPAALPADTIRSFLAYAASLGLVDAYNSDRAFIRTKMTPVAADGRSSADAGFGWLKRDDRVICYAALADGSVQFVSGPAATGQQFPQGGVIVQVEGKRHGVQPAEFLATYLNPDRTPIRIEEIRKLA